jgi:hypothetical protein
MFEWAEWWDKTHRRWQDDGLPADVSHHGLHDYFQLDRLEGVFVRAISGECPSPAYHGASIITDETSYEAVRPHLFTEGLVDWAVQQARAVQEKHEKGEIALRLWLDGFFWFPRSLFGIENHLFAFYDYPDLMHRMNRELTDFNLRAMDKVFDVVKPDMVGIAEDMSYNNGPMLSYALFQEFLAPYYKEIVAYIKGKGIKVLVDTDGDLTQMIPWLREVGVQGIYPLERQAGVDVAEIRRQYPDFILMGAYDKMVMSQGEDAMRAEFERLLPVMRTGGLIPSVDHQTPPGVSLENYWVYRRLFEEYCVKAVQ